MSGKAKYHARFKPKQALTAQDMNEVFDTLNELLERVDALELRLNEAVPKFDEHPK